MNDQRLNDYETRKLQHLVQTIDLVFNAMMTPRKAETFHEQTVVCPVCGAHDLRMSRDPKAPASVMAVCNACSAGG